MRTKYIIMLLLCFFSLQTNAQTEKYVEKYDNGQIKKSIIGTRFGDIEKALASIIHKMERFILS